MLLHAGRVGRNARTLQRIDPSRRLSPVWLLPSAYQPRKASRRWTSSTLPLSAPPVSTPATSSISHPSSSSASISSASTSSSSTPSSSTTSSIKPKETSRKFNTAATSYPDFSGKDVLPPFADPGKPPKDLGLYSSPLWKPDGPSSMVILQTPKQGQIQDRRRTHPTLRKDPYYLGIIGHKQEAEANFHALLKVGDLDRAEQMLVRMTEVSESPLQAKDGQTEDLDALDLLSNHNSYLGAWLEKGKELEEGDSERKQCFKKVLDWYYQMIRQFNMEGNATTLAIVLEASYRKENSLLMQRQLIKYVDVWRGRPKALLGDLLQNRYLSDEALVTIIKVCNIKPDELYPEQQIVLEKYKVEKPSMDDVPQIMSANIKGHGLKAVQQSLRSFTDPNYIPVNVSAVAADHPDAAVSDYLFREERQKLLEKDAYSSALDKWQADFKSLMDAGVASFNKDLNPLMYSWHQQMLPLIEEEIKRIDAVLANGRETKPHGRYDYGPLFKLLSPKKLAALTILTVMRHAATDNVSDGMRTTSAVISVGKAVELESMTETIRKKEARDAKEGLGHKYFDQLKNERDMRKYIYYFRKKREESKDVSEEDTTTQWTKRYQGIIGGVLVSMLMHCATVPVPKPGVKSNSNNPDDFVNFPAFYHTYQFHLGKKVGVIKLHKELMGKLSSMPLRGSLLSKQLPMVVEPQPWKSWNCGGYYYNPVRVMRTKDSVEQLMYTKEASKRGDLELVYSGLDVLGATPWNINQKVFKVVADVWNSGQDLAGIPTNASLELPEEPGTDMTPEEKKKWLKECRRVNTTNINNHSQRCDVNFKLEISRAFYHEKFYFPHNIDFRGRAYPIPPHLNHLGNDLCRGMLIFAEGKPLGKNGLDWIKIHLANVCGFDKASLAERKEFAEAHMDDVYDSVDNPLGGRRWWLEAEDPWQCLSTCFELAAAIRSGNPETFESRLPVHQDGTCNGLQHYAALGGDIDGARQVNLSPSNRPQDVYTGVMELVKKEMEEDLKSGNKYNQKYAAIAIPILKRKVVKQTVMTSVYGVTFHGGKEQVRARLEEIPELDRDIIGPLATYIAKKIFASLKTMFTGAHEIQGWFGECARRISKSISPSQFDEIMKDDKTKLTDKAKLQRQTSQAKGRGTMFGGKRGGIGGEFMSSVIWTTPLGMPVVQPYRSDAKIVVKTNLQDISITDPHVLKEVNWRKQFTAFPPNFIHSLDASHMLLSALSVKEAGLTFAAVHDSFWTHAADVDQMSSVLRDAFVKLHEGNIIERLRDEFRERYKGFKTLVSIPLSHPAGRAVLAHRKKLAQDVKKTLKAAPLSAHDDLKGEILREKLLASEDPEEVEEGKAMVTAGSILEEYGYGLDSDVQQVTSDEVFGNLKLSKGSATSKLSFDAEETNVSEAEGEEEGAAADAENDEALEESEDSEGSKPKTKKAAAKKKKEAESDIVPAGTEEGPLPPMQGLVHAWVNLTFPKVPEKGEFDVKELRESIYFFS